MTLFFETERQGAAFLGLCALGFLLALVFDAQHRLLGRHLTPLRDVLTLLLGAASFVFALFVLREDEIRPYHWLALATGAMLYLCGMRRAALCLTRRLRSAHKNFARARKTEGNARGASNSTNIDRI